MATSQDHVMQCIHGFFLSLGSDSTLFIVTRVAGWRRLCPFEDCVRITNIICLFKYNFRTKIFRIHYYLSWFLDFDFFLYLPQLFKNICRPSLAASGVQSSSVSRHTRFVIASYAEIII